MARSIPTSQIVRILVTLGLLVAILVMKQRCGKATSELFRALDTRPDGGAPPAKLLTPVDATH